MRIWRTVRLPIGITAAAAIVVVALWPQPVAVDLAAVTSGPMTVTVDEDGETRVRDRFVISAPVSGRLQRIELEPGDTVA
jgi:HlyD family secretion protein